MTLISGNTLTVEELNRFIEGDFEICNIAGEEIFRGPIEEIKLEDDALYFRLKWTARGLHFPPTAKEWTRANNHLFKIPLTKTFVFKNQKEKMEIQAPVTGNVITLYSKGNNLDPKKVAHLNVTEAGANALNLN